MDILAVTEKEQEDFNAKIIKVAADMASHIYSEFSHENQIKVFNELKARLVEKRDQELNMLNAQVSDLGKMREILVSGTLYINK